VTGQVAGTRLGSPVLKAGGGVCVAGIKIWGAEEANDLSRVAQEAKEGSSQRYVPGLANDFLFLPFPLFSRKAGFSSGNSLRP